MNEKANGLISTEDYEEHHESRDDLYMPDDYINHIQCCSCGEHVPADEILPIGHDNICEICAPYAEVYRCGYCGIVFERSDTCPECGWEREKENERK